MYIMKKLGKLQINSDRLMKNEELMTLRGGYSSYYCWSEGFGAGCMGYIITPINTASCGMALTICLELEGACVSGGDCS
jgi:hypothetical protein